MLAPEDAPSWLKLVVDLFFGGLAGLLGAAARELQRTDRELTWGRVALTLGGLALGSGVFVMARGITESDSMAFGVAFVAGCLGQAAITDLLRSWLRTVLRVPDDGRGDSSQG